MHVILLERVEKLGTIGDVVNVKPGFARNFLLPRGKALRASLDGDTSEAERRSVVTDAGLAGAEGQELQGIFSIPE